MSSQRERERITRWMTDTRRTLDSLVSNLDDWRRWLDEWQVVDQTWQEYKLESMDIRSCVIVQLGALEEMEEDLENPVLPSLMEGILEGIADAKARIAVLDRLVGGLPSYNSGRGRRQ